MKLTAPAAKVAAKIKRQYPAAQADAILARAEKIARLAGRDKVCKDDIVAGWLAVGDEFVGKGEPL